MIEEEEIEEIEEREREERQEKIEKLRKNIEKNKTDEYLKIKQLDVLRYLLGEQEKEEEKVKYKEEEEDIEISESLEVSKEVIKLIIEDIKNVKRKKAEEIELFEIMKNNYYYLGRYLFSYYLVAMEFGIKKEKQFYAPRDMVLGKIAKRLEKFYYKPKGIMSINMPQRDRKRATHKQSYIDAEWVDNNGRSKSRHRGNRSRWKSV